MPWAFVLCPAAAVNSGSEPLHTGLGKSDLAPSVKKTAPSVPSPDHEYVNVIHKVQVEKQLRLSCPKHRENKRKLASVRLTRRFQQPGASALPLTISPG